METKGVREKMKLEGFIENIPVYSSPLVEEGVVYFINKENFYMQEPVGPYVERKWWHKFIFWKEFNYKPWWVGLREYAEVYK